MNIDIETIDKVLKAFFPHIEAVLFDVAETNPNQRKSQSSCAMMKSRSP